jgi:hypothetical protein
MDGGGRSHAGRGELLGEGDDRWGLVSVGEGRRLRTGSARGDAGPGPNVELGCFGPLRTFLLFLFLFHFFDFCFYFLSFANQFKSDQNKILKYTIVHCNVLKQ